MELSKYSNQMHTGLDIYRAVPVEKQFQIRTHSFNVKSMSQVISKVRQMTGSNVTQSCDQHISSILRTLWERKRQDAFALNSYIRMDNLNKMIRTKEYASNIFVFFFIYFCVEGVYKSLFLEYVISGGPLVKIAIWKQSGKQFYLGGPAQHFREVFASKPYYKLQMRPCVTPTAEPR